MTKLKPCPFCGGLPRSYKCESDYGCSFNIVECSQCEVKAFAQHSLENGEESEAEALWNTRQPAFDWKPIEELTEEDLKQSIKLGSIQILLFKSCLFYMADITNTLHLYGFRINDIKYSIERVKREFTHYALLTPPQSNQSQES